MNDSLNSKEKVSDLEQDADLGQDISIIESSIEAQNDSAKPVLSCTNQLQLITVALKVQGRLYCPRKTSL